MQFLLLKKKTYKHTFDFKRPKFKILGLLDVIIAFILSWYDIYGLGRLLIRVAQKGNKMFLLYILTSLTLMRLVHIIITSHPVSGVFFCFPVSAISVFEVSCHRSLGCSWNSVAKTHYMIIRAYFRSLTSQESFLFPGCGSLSAN